MRVKLIKAVELNTKSMTFDKEYEVIGIEADSYRIICDSWEPYLYEPELFELIDPTQPQFWVRERGDDGELYAYPEAWFHDCFFDRYFDNEPGIAERFWKECARLYGITKNA